MWITVLFSEFINGIFYLSHAVNNSKTWLNNVQNRKTKILHFPRPQWNVAITNWTCNRGSLKDFFPLICFSSLPFRIISLENKKGSRSGNILIQMLQIFFKANRPYIQNYLFCCCCHNFVGSSNTEWLETRKKIWGHFIHLKLHLKTNTYQIVVNTYEDHIKYCENETLICWNDEC